MGREGNSIIVGYIPIKVEQILEVDCPKCGARASTFCDRTGDKLRGQGKWLASQGMPPSHTERMWLRQGHDPLDFGELRQGLKPGRYPARGNGKKQRRMFRQGKPGTAAGSGYGL